MLCYVILNGEKIDNLVVPENAYVIATDGAVDFCKKQNIKIDKAVGDFDSLGFIPQNSVVFPTEKDFTDGEIALNEAIKQGANKIVFACGGGLREDHFLCNLSLLEIAESLGVSAMLKTNYADVYFVKSQIKLNVEVNSFVSVVAVENAVISSAKGLKYPYPKEGIKRASTLGLSNVATSNEIEISVSSGSVFVFVNKEKLGDNH